VAHLPGSADEIRARVPAVREAYEFIRDNVLRDGVVDQPLKELCFRYVAGDPDVADPSRYAGREQAALEWTHAIVWDSDEADDELWERLHALFTEEELVDLGCAVGFELGHQHFVRTLGLRPEIPHAPASRPRS
jgi:alkylhydroperoxidase family enzyme